MKNAKEIDRLLVLKGRSRVGELSRTHGGYEFSFHPDWHRRAISYRISGSPTPLFQQGESLPPFFANLLPEGYRLKALRESVKTSEDDLFSLLVAAGGSFVGDVQIEIEDAVPRVPIDLSPKGIDFHEFFLKHAGGSFPDSFSGVQEKISSSMITLPVSLARKKWQAILKLNPAEKPNLVENEFACMTLAKKCGLPVASVRRIYDKSRNPGLLVERFDRSWSADENRFDMIHQEDGCQILNVYPSQKYRMSWNDLVHAVQELTGGSSVQTMGMVKLYVFSYLIGNGDLHAKNLSLYDPPGHPRSLTPAYDLVCTRIYGDDSMALKWDGRDRGLKRSQVLAFGVRFGLPPIAIEMMLDKLLGLLAKNLEILFSIPMDAKMSRLLRAMVTDRMKDMAG
jgi:serine/threonine-protein kinase HipA